MIGLMFVLVLLGGGLIYLGLARTKLFKKIGGAIEKSAEPFKKTED